MSAHRSASRIESFGLFEANPPARRPCPASSSRSAAIVVLGVGLAAGVAYLRGHGLAGLGIGPSTVTQALSIGTGGGGDWVVRRGVEMGNATRLPGATHNVLSHTTDGGQSWQDRLTFDGNYEGMSWTADGRIGVLWTSDMTRPCGATARTCNLPPGGVVTATRRSMVG